MLEISVDNSTHAHARMHARTHACTHTHARVVCFQQACGQYTRAYMMMGRGRVYIYTVRILHMTGHIRLPVNPIYIKRKTSMNSQLTEYKIWCRQGEIPNSEQTKKWHHSSSMIQHEAAIIQVRWIRNPSAIYQLFLGRESPPVESWWLLSDTALPPPCCQTPPGTSELSLSVIQWFPLKSFCSPTNLHTSAKPLSRLDVIGTPQ